MLLNNKLGTLKNLSLNHVKVITKKVDAIYFGLRNNDLASKINEYSNYFHSRKIPTFSYNSIDDVKKYLDIGVKHFSIETDITILYNYWKQNGDEIRKLLS